MPMARSAPHKHEHDPLDMAMAAADHHGGVTCAAPTDHELITFVLRPMAAAAGQHQGFDGFVHLADVYSASPETLANRYAPAPPGTAAAAGNAIWYFLCPARCRHRAAAAGALGQGCWAASSLETTGAARPVTTPDGRCVGQVRALFYSYGGARAAAPWAAVTKHGWCMVELSIDDQDAGGSTGGFVLCKLFRSPRNGKAVAAAAAPAIVSSCKRKAAVDEHPDAPPGVRQQLMQRSY
ncbi:unnamed protein product [Urochloa humidicola]